MYNINSYNTLAELSKIDVKLESLCVSINEAVLQLNRENVYHPGSPAAPEFKADPYYTLLNNNLLAANDEVELAAQHVLRIKQLLLRNAIYAGHDTHVTAAQ